MTKSDKQYFKKHIIISTICAAVSLICALLGVGLFNSGEVFLYSFIVFLIIGGYDYLLIEIYLKSNNNKNHKNNKNNK